MEDAPKTLTGTEVCVRGFGALTEEPGCCQAFAFVLVFVFMFGERVDRLLNDVWGVTEQGAHGHCEDEMMVLEAEKERGGDDDDEKKEEWDTEE